MKEQCEKSEEWTGIAEWEHLIQLFPPPVTLLDSKLKAQLQQKLKGDQGDKEGPGTQEEDSPNFKNLLTNS